jgi:hypothetical protein
MYHHKYKLIKFIQEIEVLKDDISDRKIKGCGKKLSKSMILNHLQTAEQALRNAKTCLCHSWRSDKNIEVVSAHGEKTFCVNVNGFVCGYMIDGGGVWHTYDKKWNYKYTYAIQDKVVESLV